jgi:hypothetical protein
MKYFIIFLSLICTTQSFGAVLCKSGPVNLRAKHVCLSAIQQMVGKVIRFDEGYGDISISNQYTMFAALAANGQECGCRYSDSYRRPSGPFVTCGEGSYKDFRALIRYQCSQ